MRSKWTWLVLIVVCLPAVWPLIHGGFFHFSDEKPHIANLYEMVRGFESGQVPPRWAPDMSYGYGYPFFNFYYPLPFYLGSGFFVLTHSLIGSLKWVFAVTVPLSAWLMYLWLRQHTGKLGSMVGAVIYVYTPYRAVDLYVRGAVGEALAFVFFPAVALASYKALEMKGWRRVAILGLAVGGLMLSHNLAPMIFLPWVVAYTGVVALIRKNGAGLLRVIFGVVLGLGLAAYWWVPAVLEKGLLASQTPFNYVDHFPFVKQLILPSWGYGASVWGPGDELSFQVGIVNWILILLLVGMTFAGVVKKTGGERGWLRWLFLGSLGLCLYLMNIRSDFIWRAFTLAPYIQFPWRILMMTSFLTGASVIFLPKGSLGKWGLVLLGGASVVLTVGYFSPSEYFYPESDDYYLKEVFANRSVDGVRKEFSEEYKNYSEDYLLLPLWVKLRPSSLPAAKFVSETVTVAEIDEINAVSFKAKVESEKGGVVEMNNYYFPGWEVTVDGREVTPKVLSPYGNMGVEVASGVHEIGLRWKETDLRKRADIVSVVSLVLILGMWIKKGRSDVKE